MYVNWKIENISIYQNLWILWIYKQFTGSGLEYQTNLQVLKSASQTWLYKSTKKKWNKYTVNTLMAVTIIIYYCSYCICIQQTFPFNLKGHRIMCANYIQHNHIIIKILFWNYFRTNDPSDQWPFRPTTLLTNDPLD